jgi:hypothetical protein
VEAISHQAVAEEAEGIAFLGVGDGLERGEVIGVVGEDIIEIVAPVESVVGQSVRRRWLAVDVPWIASLPMAPT